VVGAGGNPEDILNYKFARVSSTLISEAKKEFSRLVSKFSSLKASEEAEFSLNIEMTEEEGEGYYISLYSFLECWFKSFWKHKISDDRFESFRCSGVVSRKEETNDDSFEIGEEDILEMNIICFVEGKSENITNILSEMEKRFIIYDCDEELVDEYHEEKSIFRDTFTDTLCSKLQEDDKEWEDKYHMNNAKLLDGTEVKPQYSNKHFHFGKIDKILVQNFEKPKPRGKKSGVVKLEEEEEEEEDDRVMKHQEVHEQHQEEEEEEENTMEKQKQNQEEEEGSEVMNQEEEEEEDSVVMKEEGERSLVLKTHIFEDFGIRIDLSDFSFVNIVNYSTIQDIMEAVVSFQTQRNEQVLAHTTYQYCIFSPCMDASRRFKEFHGKLGGCGMCLVPTGDEAAIKNAGSIQLFRNEGNDKMREEEEEEEEEEEKEGGATSRGGDDVKEGGWKASYKSFSTKPDQLLTLMLQNNEEPDIFPLLIGENKICYEGDNSVRFKKILNKLLLMVLIPFIVYFDFIFVVISVKAGC